MKSWFPPESAKYLGIGLQLAVSILLGLGGGYFIDKKFHHLPWFTLAGSAVGFFIGFYNVLEQLKNKNSDVTK